MAYRVSEMESEIEKYFADLERRGLADIQILHQDEARGNPNNDYYIEWSIEAKPKSPYACPIEIIYVEPGYYGFGICTFGNLAQKIGLNQPPGREAFVAGHEPVKLCVSDLIDCCSRIVNEGVSVDYRRRFGRLISANAFINGARLPSIRPWGLGIRGHYEYQAW